MDDFYDFLYEKPADQNPANSAARPAMQYAPVNETWSAPAQPVHTRRIPAKKKKGVGVGGIIAIALVCSLLGGLLGAGGILLTNGSRTAETSLSQAAEIEAPTTATLSDPQNNAQALLSNRNSAELDLAQVDNSTELTPAQVYAKNVNSTVGITTEIQSTNYWGYQTTGAASGSGFIMTEDGYILTNYHVIEGASSITVTMYSGASYRAELVGYDENSDVAVLKIDADNLSPVILGNSDKLNVGDTVMAIGNPLGELTFSLTVGVVSALNRDITMSSGSTMRLIQTDAAINSGNSGGALFNSYGEVVGITNAKYSSSGYGSGAEIDNIGFAIPINSVLKIASAIMENGFYAQPYLGVTITDVDSEALENGTPAGALIKEIASGSPAASAGLQAGDVITAANGTAIANSSDLCTFIDTCTVGDSVVFTVYRDGETRLIAATIGEKPQTTQVQNTTPADGWSNGWGGSSGDGNGSDDGSDDGWGSWGGFGGFGGFGGWG